MRMGTGIRALVAVLLCAVLGACGKADKDEDDGLGESLERGPAFDFTPVLRALEAEEYSVTYGFLGESLVEDWPKEQFVEQLGAWRAEIGEHWSPELTGHGRSGRAVHASYRLTKDWNTKYRLDLIALPQGDDYTIILLNATAPVDDADGQLAQARETVGRFLALMTTEDYAAVKTLIMPRVQDTYTESSLRRIRGMFWEGAEGEVEFTEQEAVRSVSNGVVYYRIDCMPKHKIASLKLNLEQHESAMRIGAIGFGVKVGD